MQEYFNNANNSINYGTTRVLPTSRDENYYGSIELARELVDTLTQDFESVTPQFSQDALIKALDSVTNLMNQLPQGVNSSQVKLGLMDLYISLGLTQELELFAK